MTHAAHRLIIFNDPRGGNSDEGKELFRLATEQRLEVADEPIDVTFPRRFGDDVFVVIVSKSSRKFFVIHFWFILTFSPSTGDLQINR